MSDYIYGSSLRAAKSKANYLFDGDFRRRPNQNLSGASRSVARGELLQQAAEQRQNREDIRKKEQACIRLQSYWRGYLCRGPLRQQMRHTFDNLTANLKLDKSKRLDEREFNNAFAQFILLQQDRQDAERLDNLIDIVLENYELLISWRHKDPKSWFFRMFKLLVLNLRILKNNGLDDISKYINFLDKFTKVPYAFDNNQSYILWQYLIGEDFYAIMRCLVDKNNQKQDKNIEDGRVIFEIIRRSLDFDAKQDINDIPSERIYSFFKDFLRSPSDTMFDDVNFSNMIKLKPIGLEPRYVLRAFQHFKHPINNYTGSLFNNHQLGTNGYPIDDLQKCESDIWLCYSFIRAIFERVDSLSELEKLDYIIISSMLMCPAEHITNLSLMQAANQEDEDSDSLADDIDTPFRHNQVGLHHSKINVVITQIIAMINNYSHIASLKSIILNSDLLRSQVQTAIIRICNVMLTHEPSAIFNCRLLYTIAFSREFSRLLWKSIVTTKSSTLFGDNSPIYLQIIRGVNMDESSWNQILPQLRLFCSLYSCLLPTLDDEEFHSDSEYSVFNENELQDRQNNVSTKHRAFLMDKDLVSISANLRDICIGFIRNLYQDNRYSWHHSKSKNLDDSSQRNRVLSFEIKQCFKALVRLISQMHARDSRKQFCPDGHWISPAVTITANKAIDFQLVTSHQGRLISQMTKDNNEYERTSVPPSEIMMILILQEIPFVVSFQDRVRIFHQLLKKEKRIHQSEGYHFGLPGPTIQIQVRRNYIYEDAFEKLSLDNEPNLKLPLKVSMINAAGAEEAGVDGGGLTKEFLGELLKSGFDPMRGFFKSTRDNHLYPNPSANILFSTIAGGHETHYEFLGRILGKAIYEKMMVELPLAGFFLAKLLARKHSSDVDIHNLASLDPVLYKNLVYLKNYKGDVADLNLDFTISNNDLDEHEVVELKAGGSKIPLTHDNKIEYVHLVADYRLNKQIRSQCAAFKRGLSQLVDLDWLRMFDPRELQILISGAPTNIDIEDWRRNTHYSNGYTDTCEAIETFWRVAKRFDEDKKRKLLKFATSCSLPPLLGFKDLVPQFTIAPSEGTRLPTASTCMNLLKLPDCQDEVTMKSKLLYAIESNAGFELS